MKIIFLIIFSFFSFNIYSQVVPFGLSGKVVNSITLTKTNYEKVVIAGTEGNGIYFHNLSNQDTSWEHHYFYNRTISSLYVQLNGRGSADFSGIFAALVPDLSSIDTTLIYFNNYPVQSYWADKDSGLITSEVGIIKTFAGFDYSGEEPPLPVFASAGDSIIYKFKNEVWEKTWTGPQFTNIKTLYSNNSTIWGGGIIQNAFAALFLVKSDNYGENWKIIYPPFGEIYSCYSIVTPLEDSLTVYSGLNDLIIKSTDGGKNWNTIFTESNVVFNSLIINPANSEEIFAGGRTIDNSFVLQKSNDEGKHWQVVTPAVNCCVKGINSMAAAVVNDNFELFIATNGDGVFYYEESLVSLNEQNNNSPKLYKLEQNYPNPFNPSTTISYEIPNEAKVSIKIYNTLGKEVAALINKVQIAGKYEIEWNADNFASGIYFYTIRSNNFILTKKMVLIK
ncbi:MAG: T9SS type A sorting domain-containing protein [Ignavibacteriaceae bacterium]